jgi:hypothetical protein
MAELNDDLEVRSTNGPTGIARRLLSVETAVAVTVILILGHMILGSIDGTRIRHTCVTCRLERVNYKWRYSSSTQSTYKDTECSRWYSSRIQGSHNHDWAPTTSISLVDYYGNTLGVATTFDYRGDAVQRITPMTQMKIYQHFSDHAEAERLFVSLADSTSYEKRQNQLVVDSLLAWVDSGFATQWQSPVPLPDPARKNNQ